RECSEGFSVARFDGAAGGRGAVTQSRPRPAELAMKGNRQAGACPTVGWHGRGGVVRSYTVVIERCPETRLYVGYVPGFPGAHSQGETREELRENMREVIAMLLEDGEPALESEFVGVQTVEVT